MHHASRSRSRPDLNPNHTPRGGGVPSADAASARPPEADDFEREYPGASWAAGIAFARLSIVGGKAQTVVATAARRHGLSHAALNALAVIEGAGGPLPTGEIGARMHVTTGTVTSVLDTLERNGLVVRLADPDDRRRVLVDITPTAQATLDDLLPEIQQLATLIMGVLDDDQLRSFRDMLTSVDASIGSVPAELPSPPARRRPTRLTRS